MPSNATGARIADATATGTIENDDPLQQAWIERFARTVATQAVDAFAERFAGGCCFPENLGRSRPFCTGLFRSRILVDRD